MNRNESTFQPPRNVVHNCTALMLLGAASLFTGMLFATQQTWANLLLVSFALLGMGLAGLLLVALQYVTLAGWGVALRRVPEAMTAVLPFGALGLILVLLLHPSMYPWTTHHFTGFKHFWLSRSFFLVRAVVYLLCWYLFASAIVSASRRQDMDGDVKHTRKNVALSAVFLVVFGITIWLASYDWIMSLDPEWYSTIFGVYNFAGLFLSGLAAVVLLVLWLRRLGPFQHILTENHLHDLGKLIFAFSTFWMYCWFCQYMLIWYVNNPEETMYFTPRLRGAWGPIVVVNLVLNWAIPFFVLLPQSAKRSPGVMAKICAILLVGRWLDLYLMIAPAVKEPLPGGSATQSATVIGVVVGVGLALGAAGLCLRVILFALPKASLVPTRDPLLCESLGHDAESPHPETV